MENIVVDANNIGSIMANIRKKMIKNGQNNFSIVLPKKDLINPTKYKGIGRPRKEDYFTLDEFFNITSPLL